MNNYLEFISHLFLKFSNPNNPANPPMKKNKKEKIITFYKIAFMGPQGSGKTSIISQFVNNYFDLKYRPTSGYQEDYIKILDINKDEGGKSKSKNYIAIKIQDCIGCDNPMLRDKRKIKKGGKINLAFREQMWMKYCLENLKINEMVKEMDIKYRKNKKEL